MKKKTIGILILIAVWTAFEALLTWSLVVNKGYPVKEAVFVLPAATLLALGIYAGIYFLVDKEYL